MPGAAIDLSTETALDLWKISRDKHAWPHGNKLNILTTQHEFHVMNRWFGKDRAEFDGGPQIDFEIVLDNLGTARHIQPNEVRTYAVSNSVKKIQVPWRIANSYYVISDEEVMRNYKNGGFGQLFKLLDVRRATAGMDQARLFESRAWLTPGSSADVTNPYGVPYWVVKVTAAQVTAATNGTHVGQNPLYGDTSSMGSCGGIDSSLAANALWRNYCDTWDTSAATMTDTAVQRIIKMRYQTKFAGPMNVKEFFEGAYDDCQYYTGLEVLLNMEQKARDSNDSLGADLGKFSGQVVIRGNPVNRVDALDYANDSTYPLYQIDHSVFKPFCQSGEFMKEIGPGTDLAQPRTLVTNTDTTYNFLAYNRRRLGVMSYQAAG